MTKWTDIDRMAVAKAVHKEMPHLEFAVWDLEPFMKGFHDWRKNLVFVECENLAVDELAQRLSLHFHPRLKNPRLPLPVHHLNR
jgi:hypothetical protein